MTWKSKQVSLDRLFLGLFFRQDSKRGLKDRKYDLKQVFRQTRNPYRVPVLLENLSESLFSVFRPCYTVLSEKQTRKRPVQRNLPRFSCHDLKPVPEPVFCRQVAEPSLASFSTRQKTLSCLKTYYTSYFLSFPPSCPGSVDEKRLFSYLSSIWAFVFCRQVGEAS